MSSALNSSEFLSEISSQSSGKIGKTQPDILGMTMVKISIKKNPLLTQRQQFQACFKYLKQDKNLCGSAALQNPSNLPMQFSCFLFVNRIKPPQAPGQNCAHKNGKKTNTVWTYPSLQWDMAECELRTCSHLGIQVLMWWILWWKRSCTSLVPDREPPASTTPVGLQQH